MLKQISNFIPEVKDNYFIDEFGKLYSNAKILSDKTIDKKGYIRNGIGLKSGGYKSMRRHRLVMLCFEPIEDSDKKQVNHIDGNKLNNCYSNLEWCSCRENKKHAIDNDLIAHLYGEKNPANILSEDDVLGIVDMINKGKLYKDIMAKYGCSKSTVSSIRHKRNWSYLTHDLFIA